MVQNVEEARQTHKITIVTISRRWPIANSDNERNFSKAKWSFELSGTGWNNKKRSAAGQKGRRSGGFGPNQTETVFPCDLYSKSAIHFRKDLNRR